MPNSPFPHVLERKLAARNDQTTDEYLEAQARCRDDRIAHYQKVVQQRPDALAYRPRP